MMVYISTFVELGKLSKTSVDRDPCAISAIRASLNTPCRCCRPTRTRMFSSEPPRTSPSVPPSSCTISAIETVRDWRCSATQLWENTIASVWAVPKPKPDIIVKRDAFMRNVSWSSVVKTALPTKANVTPVRMMVFA